MHQNDKNTHIRTLISSSLMKKRDHRAGACTRTMLYYLLLDYQLKFIINDHFSVCDLRGKKPFNIVTYWLVRHCYEKWLDRMSCLSLAHSDTFCWPDTTMNMILGNGDKFGLPCIWHNIYSLELHFFPILLSRIWPSNRTFCLNDNFGQDKCLNSQDYTPLSDKKDK